MTENESLVAKLQAALDHAGNTHTVRDVAEAVRHGEATMWGSGGTIAITELVDYPQFPALRIWLVAGELSGCDLLLPDIERHARKHGCRRIEAIGRLGWSDYGKHHGYEPVATMFRKELDA